jgi:hypothetical protein
VELGTEGDVVVNVGAAAGVRVVTLLSTGALVPLALGRKDGDVEKTGVFVLILGPCMLGALLAGEVVVGDADGVRVVMGVLVLRWDDAVGVDGVDDGTEEASKPLFELALGPNGMDLANSKLLLLPEATTSRSTKRR